MSNSNDRRVEYIYRRVFSSSPSLFLLTRRQNPSVLNSMDFLRSVVVAPRVSPSHLSAFPLDDGKPGWAAPFPSTHDDALRMCVRARTLHGSFTRSGGSRGGWRGASRETTTRKTVRFWRYNATMLIIAAALPWRALTINSKWPPPNARVRPSVRRVVMVHISRISPSARRSRG